MLRLRSQIGVKGKVDSVDGKPKSRFLNASPVAFYSPTQVAVDPVNGDVFVADGYATSASSSSIRPGSSYGSGGARARRPTPPRAWAAHS